MSSPASSLSKPQRIICSLLLIAATLVPLTGRAIAADYPVQPVSFTAVAITGGFWQTRQEINRTVTIPFAFQQCEETKRIANFDLAAETMRRRAAGESTFQNQPPTIYPFDDTDLYKIIEAASYALSVKPDPALERRIDGYIARIAAAQEADGYLYTFRTMHPDSPAHKWIDQKRWLKDPDLSHELYNLGHLYEAGVAYAQATGKRSLLDVCLRSAELLDHDFGPGRLQIAPGHQIIEMGLAKLYRMTGDPRWINLAKFFLDVRGPAPGVNAKWAAYSQRHLPVLQQTSAVGHAVRANYMYCGMTDVAALTGDKSYLTAVNAIWDNVAGRKMHLTGGVGSRPDGEAYGNDYELPHDCYNETCAAIAFMMWNHRLFLMTGEAKYMDVFERTAFNGFISGISLSGDRFFYPNTLVYDGKKKNNHGFAGRAPWFGCACCPPNVMRTLASLSGYFYATRDDRLFVNFYAQSQATVAIKDTTVLMTQDTEYPWKGVVKLTVTPKQAATFTVAIRIPGWVQGHPVPTDLYTYDDATPAAWTVSVASVPCTAKPENGYLLLTRTWEGVTTIAIDFPMPVRRVAGHPAIAATRGQVALERGPLVYCQEAIDAADDATLQSYLPDGGTATTQERPDLLGGVVTLSIPAKAMKRAAGATDPTITAIPYFAWNNRGLAAMRTWFPRSEASAAAATTATIASTSTVSVSFARQGMVPTRLNDQLVPQNATDGFAAPAFDFWPHLGSQEWMQYDFAKPATVRDVSILWFDDTGRGACRVPSSWRLLYRQGQDWIPVKNPSEYGVGKDALQTTTFDPVTTDALRLEVQLQPGMSAGAVEWMVK
jgi:DUF1680 family protein